MTRVRSTRSLGMLLTVFACGPITPDPGAIPSNPPPPTVEIKTFRPAVFVSGNISFFDAPTIPNQIVSSAYRPLMQAAEISYAITFGPTVDYVETLYACGIDFQQEPVTHGGSGSLDTLRVITPMQKLPDLPDSARWSATDEGDAFANAHGYGPLPFRRPAWVFFPGVQYLDEDSIPRPIAAATPEAAAAPDFGDIRGITWVSTTLMTSSLVKAIIGAHELAHMTLGVPDLDWVNRDWSYVMNLLSKPGVTVSVWDGRSGVRYTDFTNAVDYGPAATNGSGSQCSQMRTNTAYLE